MYKNIKTISKVLQPKIQIGKNGVTDTLIEQVKRYTKKHKIAKIKLLKSFREQIDHNDQLNKLTKGTDTIIVHSIGNIIVLMKRDLKIQNLKVQDGKL